MKSNNPILAALLLTSGFAFGQLSPSKEMPVPKVVDLGPYLFPVNPGKQNWLAGTMGELRNTHFHAGIDIRTNNMSGVPVRATQSGFVSRAMVSSYGYGHVLFVTHPDGNVSVYAHLDHFKGKLGAFVLNKHYEKKSFDLDLEFTPDQFPVNRGDTIALSGNTGGSNGPHLHFEIRDDKNEALNPLSFKFDEIKDPLPPVAQQLALKTIGIDARINGRSGRTEYNLIRSGSNYFLPYDIPAQGKIGIELLAFDRMDFSRFRCGINEIEMLVDSQKVFSQKIDKIDFNNTRDIVSLLNFQTLKTRGLRFNKLYIDDGNPLKYYEQGLNRGEINVTDKSLKIQINLKDTYGNQSTIHFRIKPATPNNITLAPLTKPFEYDIAGNILSLHVRTCGSKDKITLFEKGAETSMVPQYKGLGHDVYLIDLQKMVPDSAVSCQGIIPFHLTDNIPSRIEYTYYSDLADIHFPHNSLYDTLFLNLSKEQKGKSEIFSVGRTTEPLNNPIEITLKQLKTTDHEKTSVYHVEGRSYEFIGGTLESEGIQFKTSSLGDFVLLKDTVAPFIHRLQCHSFSARFRIRDNLSGIASYVATINGEWLLMKYDYKTGILQSERLDNTKPMKGDFELTVTDNEGNAKVYKQKIL